MTLTVLASLVAFWATPSAGPLTGSVRASDGTPLPRAVVVVHQGSETVVANTRTDGTFAFADVTLPALVEVTAPGFATVRQTVSVGPVEFLLAPMSITESVVVTAPAVPPAMMRDDRTGSTVLSAEMIDQIPSVTIDEALRAVSGVTLFRRSSSRASNPTTHGVTMRGLSASGASRGLVLLDGVPLNDGFGGWVTWTRVPALAAETVVVDRGPRADTFGSDALGGAIHVISADPARPRAVGAASGGSESLAAFDGSAGGRVGRAHAFGAASWFRTDGVIPLAPESRGAVDAKADAEWFNLLGKAEIRGSSHRATFMAWGGKDDRGNGTVLQRNTMRGSTVGATYEAISSRTTFAARVTTTPNEFHQTFTAVPAPRAVETLTSTQDIDTRTTRALAEAGTFFGRGYVVARASLARASAEFVDARSSSTIRQSLDDNSEALSLHANITPHMRLSLGGGVRREWRAAPFSDNDRDEATVGQVSAAWTVADRTVVRASAATSHRWPTLNELVRNFQVGSTLTQANPDLTPERGRAADVAVSTSGALWEATVTGFWSRVDDAIANVTLPSLTGIVRQRRNAGEAHARGVELDGGWQIVPRVRLRASATLVDARFRDSQEPALEGNRLPQVPKASVAVGGDFTFSTALEVSGLWRRLSRQFDDDRNQFELAPASQLDLRVAGRYLQVGWEFVVENASDARLEVGRTPLVTLAPGRTVRVGVRWSR